MKNQWDLRTIAQTVLALMLLSLGLMIWDDQGARTPTSVVRAPRPNIYTPDTVARINKHLQWTEKQSDLAALAREVENAELSPEPKMGRPVHPNKGPTNPFESEDMAGRVYRDLEPDAGKFDSPRLPADRISSLLEQRQWVEKYDRKQTEEFIKAVRENARRAGYELQISNDLKVVNVKRLPNAVNDGRPDASR